MNAISVVADTFSYIIITVYKVLHMFLELNFTVVTSILENINILMKIILDKLSVATEVFNYYYQDFVIFLYEVVSITSFTTDVITNFLCKAYFKIRYIVSIFSEFICITYVSAIGLSNLICFCVVQAFANTLYLLQLVFTSVLLILEAGPNLLIFMCETSLHCLFCIFNSFKRYAASLSKDIYYIYIETSEAVFSIPVKAYFGALLFIIAFYQYRYIVNFFKAYVMLLLLFLKYIWQQIICYMSICLKPAVHFVGTSFKNIRSVFYSENEPETEIFYEASSSYFNVNRQSHPKRKRKFHDYIQGVKSLFPICPFVNKHHIEEQIEQLRNELSAEREKHLCIICYDRPRNIILYPCKHMCICEDCYTTLRRELQGCPLCRSSIININHVYS